MKATKTVEAFLRRLRLLSAFPMRLDDKGLTFPTCVEAVRFTSLWIFFNASMIFNYVSMVSPGSEEMSVMAVANATGYSSMDVATGNATMFVGHFTLFALIFACKIQVRKLEKLLFELDDLKREYFSGYTTECDCRKRW